MICITCGTQFSPPGKCPECKWDTDATHDVASLAAPGVVLAARYSIQEFLGAGRFGVCFKATDFKLNADVVIKFIHPAFLPTPPHIKRFIDGMSALRGNSPPAAAKHLDVGHLNGDVYVSSEFLDGGSLADLLNARVRSKQPFTVKEIYPILKETAACLVEYPIPIHGALCPKNIFIQSGNIKVLDCGLIANLPEAVVGYRMASTSTRRRYVAPEIIAGNSPRPRSDVYSLGVILAEMLSLKKYDGRLAMVKETNPELPHEVEHILSCALAENLKNRYRDVEVLLTALSNIAGLPAPQYNRQWGSNEDSIVEEISHEQEDITAQIVMKDVIQQHYEEVTSMNEPVFRNTPLPPKPTTEQSLKKNTQQQRLEQPLPRPVSSPPVPKRASAPPMPRPPRASKRPGSAASPTHPKANIALPRPSMPPVPPSETPSESRKASLPLPSPTSPSVNAAEPTSNNISSVASTPAAANHSPSFSTDGDAPNVSPNAPAKQTDDNEASLDGINPRFIRAAKKLQTGPQTGIQPAAKDSVTFLEDEDWRDRISQETSTNEDSIVSFLAPDATSNDAVHIAPEPTVQPQTGVPTVPSRPPPLPPPPPRAKKPQ